MKIKSSDKIYSIFTARSWFMKVMNNFESASPNPVE